MNDVQRRELERHVMKCIIDMQAPFSLNTVINTYKLYANLRTNFKIRYAHHPKYHAGYFVKNPTQLKKNEVRHIYYPSWYVEYEVDALYALIRKATNAKGSFSVLVDDALPVLKTLISVMRKKCDYHGFKEGD